MPKSSRKQASRSRNRSDRESQIEVAESPATRRRFFLGVLGVLVVISAGVYFYSGGVTGILNRMAAEAIASRNLAQAKSYIDYALRISPSDAEAIFLEARIARRQSDAPETIRLLKLALQRGYDPQKIERERILLEVQGGNLSEHEDQVQSWLQESPLDAAEISEAYANGLAATSRFDDAATILNAWHLDFPNDPAPLFRLGRMNEHFSDQQVAIEKYRQAIAIDARYLPPHFAIGRILLDQKQPEQAMSHFQVCTETPRNAAGLVGIAQCYVALGDTDAARELLNDVIVRDAEAVEESYRMVEESPERFLAAAELGKLETNAGNFAEGLRLLDLALRRNPRDNNARYSRAIALRGLGRLEEAAAELEHVEEVKQTLSQVNTLRNEINRNPDDLQARLQLGEILIAVESERTGVFWIRSALTRNPDYQPAHQALADYYKQRAGTSPEYARRARLHRSRLSSEAVPPDTKSNINVSNENHAQP